jgi:glutamyl-tRNA reductase
MKKEKLKLVVIGISHKTSSISDLELFQLNKNEIGEALKNLKSLNGVEGVAIISTCNRVEFYLSINKNTSHVTLISTYYENKIGINASKRKELFYSYYGTEAANHLFKVICGLDSMVLGEYQIQGQIKEAYSLACSEKTADKILHKLFHAAFRIGKSIRSKTKIGSGKQSVSGVAFQILKEKLSKNDTIVLIGVNQNTKIIAEKLNASGFSNLIFVNRTLYKAEKLADQYSGQAYELKKIENALLNAQCIFSCTGAPGYIIHSELIKRIYRKSNHLEIIIDIAVPRDIETNGIPNEIHVFDLEGLKTYLKNQEKEIALDLPIAIKIINDEIKLFEAWSQSQSDETIAYYDEKLESLRLQFMNETKEELSEEEYQMLDKLSRSLLHRIKSTIHQVIKTNKPQKIAS